MLAQHPRFMCRGLTYSLVVFSRTLVTRGPAQELKPPQPNPDKPVDYIEWINRTLGSGIQENAADVYRRAASTTTPFEGEWEPMLTQPWADRPDVEKWLQAHRKQMELFKQAAAMEQCFFSHNVAPSEGEETDPRFEKVLIAVTLPELSPMRHLAKGLLADGFRKWGGGDHKTLPANAGLLLRTSRHLASGPSLMHRLVALGMADSSYKSLRHALRHSDEPSKTAGELLVVLRKTDRPWPALQKVYEIERITAWDYVQRVFVPVGAVQRLLVPGGGGTHRIHANISQFDIKERQRCRRSATRPRFKRSTTIMTNSMSGWAFPIPRPQGKLKSFSKSSPRRKNL